MTDSKLQPEVTPISDLVGHPEFPNSAVGVRVDIKGFVGVVVGVVNNSIKVRSAEGNTVSYNFRGLQRLYDPRIEAETAPTDPPAPEAQPEAKAPAILEPDFSAPLVPVEILAAKTDFPACALGTFVDLHGFTGVVVALVGGSLKIRSQEGATRSYNADGLRKRYAQAARTTQQPTA